MAKLTLADISSGYASTTTINANNDLIEAALENTLSRDGTSPNTMGADLDMNSNKITNLTNGTNAQDAVSKAQLDAVQAGVVAGTAVTAVGVADGYVLTAVGDGTAAWEAVAGGGATLAGLTDFDNAGVVTGDLLFKNSTNYEVTQGKLKWDPATGTLSLLDTGSTDALTLHHDGTVGEIDESAGGGFDAKVAGTKVFSFRSDVHLSEIPLKIKESAAAVADTAAYGQFWVLNSAPNVPRFTDDAGTDWELITNGVAFSMADQVLTRPVLKDYGVTSTSPTIAAGAITFNLENGNAFQVTLNANITAITLSNPAASGTYCECIIKFIQDGTGSRTVAGWPASVKWPGGTAPTITTTATTGTDIVTLKTWDGGTTWYGDYSQNYS